MIDCAKAIPSKVDVPRPISSNKINELGVAFLIALFASIISTIKVDWPETKSSLAPILVKILSNTGSFASFAGTKQPT